MFTKGSKLIAVLIHSPLSFSDHLIMITKGSKLIVMVTNSSLYFSVSLYHPAYTYYVQLYSSKSTRIYTSTSLIYHIRDTLFTRSRCILRVPTHNDSNSVGEV